MKMLTGTLFVIVVATVAFFALRPRIARAELLKEGQVAPPFSTQMVQGDQVTPVSLADLHGKTVILYFYPKDDTPGCTKEACSFRDGFARFQAAGLVVLGCSIDSSDSHKAFIKKYNIPFPLLLDPDKTIATEYGAANGIPILGLDRRITYVIDGNGMIVKVYPKVDPSVHSTEILAELKVPENPAPAAAAPGAAPSTAQN
ncbi:MAG TPA: peroxiredoxin [Candidatus Binataceae bacterium]|nr:peroxiredoxin [Candidatus Binataceae bacterium]